MGVVAGQLYFDNCSKRRRRDYIVPIHGACVKMKHRGNLLESDESSGTMDM